MKAYSEHCPPSEIRKQQNLERLLKALGERLKEFENEELNADLEDKLGKLNVLNETEIQQVEQEHVQSFCTKSEIAVRQYLDAPEPLPHSQINKHLRKLNSTLKALPEQVAEVLAYREIRSWKGGDRLAIHPNQDLILDGVSALDILLGISVDNFKLPTHKDAMRRYVLIFNAERIFLIHGGLIDSNVSSAFGKYLFHLFGDVGLDDADISKAIRDFQKKAPFLSNFSKATSNVT